MSPLLSCLVSKSLGPPTCRIVRRLIDAGAETRATVEHHEEGKPVSYNTPLHIANAFIRDKKVAGYRINEKLRGMQGI